MSAVLHDRTKEILALHSAEIRTLLALYGLQTNEARDTFEKAIRRKMKEGIHRVWAITVLEFLIKKVGTQVQAAERLELEDRSSISHMLEKGRIDGSHLTYLIRHYGSELTFPSEEASDKGGYLIAVPFVRKHRMRDRNADEPLTLEELECLLLTLSSKPWREGQRKRDTVKLQKVGTQILADVHSAVAPPWRVKSIPMLEQTCGEWSEPFLLCLWALVGGGVIT